MERSCQFFFGQLLSAFFSFKGQRHTKGSDLNKDLERLPLPGALLSGIDLDENSTSNFVVSKVEYVIEEISILLNFNHRTTI